MLLKPDSELLTVSIASNIKMTLVHKVLPTMVQYRLWFTENPFNYIDKCILKVTLGYFFFNTVARLDNDTAHNMQSTECVC